jgi:DNA-binding HxlR family transcriptional regulator
MAPRRKDRCGARFRRRTPEDEPHVPETEELGLTGLGEALIEALKHDERFSEVIADPFGEKQEGPAATA